jgi:arylsulfatase A-like enzyme
VPCLVRWPGKIKAGRVEDRPAIMTDWLPTLVALAGGKLPDGHVHDGKDIGAALLGAGARAGDTFFWNKNTVRSGPWKMLVGVKGGLPVQLYNVEKDPSESENLAEKQPEVVQQLKARMAAFYKQ